MSTTGSNLNQPAWSNPHADPYSVQEIHAVSNQDDDDPDAFLTRPYSTLTEPVSETIMRDVRSVWTKLKVVLMPLQKSNPLEYMYQTVSLSDFQQAQQDQPSDGSSDPQQQQDEDQKKVLDTLRDWDLWGPLFVCLFLSIVLSIRAPTSQTSAVFAAVFTSMWIGSVVVTVNAKLLGGTISFFQSVCVLGYSVFPFCLSAVMILVLDKTPLGRVWLNVLWVAVGYVWAIRASTVFIARFIRRERRFLAVFPVFFYYVLLGWLVLLF
jgi:hypothetical protein